LKTKVLLFDGSAYDFMFPYDEMLPMSDGGKMAAGMPEVTYVFIN